MMVNYLFYKYNKPNTKLFKIQKIILFLKNFEIIFCLNFLLKKC